MFETSSINPARLMDLARQLGAASLALEAQGNSLLSQNLARTEGAILGTLCAEHQMPQEEKEADDITLKGIFEAHRHVRPPFLDGFFGTLKTGQVRKPTPVEITPLVREEALSQTLKRPIFVKCEGDRKSGSVHKRSKTNLLIGTLLAGKKNRSFSLMGIGTIGVEIGLQMAALGHRRFAFVRSHEEREFGGVLHYFSQSGIPVVGADPDEWDLPQELPLVFIHSGEKIESPFLRRMQVPSPPTAPPQEAPQPKGQPLEEVLTAEGYLKEGEVDDLPTAEKGLGFVRCILNHLEPGTDFIDALAGLNFGPSSNRVDNKTIKGLLRTLAGYKGELYRGDKGAALRAIIADPGASICMFADMATSKEEIGKIYPDPSLLQSILNALTVATFILDTYLDHPVWISRIKPSVSPVIVEEWKKLNRMVKKAVEKLSRGGK